MFNSATRLALIILIVILCIITVYVTIRYIPERFTAVFGLFSSVISGILGFFTGKSMKESTTGTPPSNPVENITSTPFMDMEK